jgi:hypothetical protein
VRGDEFPVTSFHRGRVLQGHGIDPPIRPAVGTRVGRCQTSEARPRNAARPPFEDRASSRFQPSYPSGRLGAHRAGPRGVPLVRYL